jgi:hypothetical protein
VRGVAADEHAPVAELARDEPAGDPILVGQELVLEVRPNFLPPALPRKLLPR